MITIQSKVLNKTIEIDRIIGHIQGDAQGPTIIFIGGIHGNEPAGIFALDDVMKQLHESSMAVSGAIYALAGNLRALKKGKRYQEKDLNRMWSIEKVERINNGDIQNSKNNDALEQLELYDHIKTILANENGPFYFFDLHTTSSKTIPFITVNDNLLNRKFTTQYPTPIVLGIEEYLNGPLLSYINELGYVAFGFEGGQHDDISAIENHIAFIYLSLIYTNSIEKNSVDFKNYYECLALSSVNSKGFYEIFKHFVLGKNDIFKMNPGFINFQKIRKGQDLAVFNGQTIAAPYSGKIFMPLYQNQGDDGFFLIRTIPKVFLKISAFLRDLRFDNWLTVLPGVRWKSKERKSLIVNRKLARFFTKEFFHLLGYRSKIVNRDHFIMKNREAVTRKNEYKNTSWYNIN